MPDNTFKEIDRWGKSRWDPTSLPTPGPWHIDEDMPTMILDDVYRDAHEVIARVSTVANARLIRSAPELLNLARRVLTYFGEEEIDSFLDLGIDLREQARKVIAKVEGR
jgi:hypothetical protein